MKRMIHVGVKNNTFLYNITFFHVKNMSQGMKSTVESRKQIRWRAQQGSKLEYLHAEKMKYKLEKTREK